MKKKMNDKTEAVAKSWLAAKIEGWGLGKTAASWIASALVGAATALLAAMQTGCGHEVAFGTNLETYSITVRQVQPVVPYLQVEKGDK